jgi:uncharacterized protein YbjT (DUF2867 family)
MKYLVTGATGNIGSLVTKRLLDTGERPCVLARDAKKARKLFGDRVEIRVGDLAGSRTDLTNVFQGCDALFLESGTAPARSRHAVQVSSISLNSQRLTSKPAWEPVPGTRAERRPFERVACTIRSSKHRRSCQMR